tara:strand:- start:890 stop:1261 length:372 start_codon:yes stop_codon:yes gene_type:complete
VSDVIKRLPWWGWALLVLVGVLVVLLSVPGLRDHAAKMLGGVFAFAFGVRSTQRRSAARDEATDAQDSITERGEVEAVQTVERRERASERAEDAEGESVRRDEPKTAEERAERLDGIVDPFKS